MNTFLEFKNLTGELKDLDVKNKIVTGYLSSFGNKDSYGDVVEPGAFKKTIDERHNDIFFLNQHSWGQPHGKFKILKEDNKGLYFESNPLIDTTFSSDLMKMYEAGIIKEHSIGYSTIESTYNKETNTRYLKELKLYEGSNVTLGANSETPFTGFKSFTTIKEIEQEQKKFIKAIKDGTFTDDTFILLEIALKQLQKQAFELGKKSLIEEKEPLIVNTPTLEIEPNKKSIEIINEFTKSL